MKMIGGIGSDIIEISRIEKAASKEAFLFRVFSEREIALCHKKPDFFAALAVRFAAKEAVLKAFGTGLRGCKWQDIEVLSNPEGKPLIILDGGAKDIASRQKIIHIWISMSHSRENAVAFCVTERGGDTDEPCDR